MYFSSPSLKVSRPIIGLILGQNAAEKTTSLGFRWAVDVNLLFAERSFVAVISDGPRSRDDELARVGGAVGARELGFEGTAISIGGAAIRSIDIVDRGSWNINAGCAVGPCNI